MDEEKDKKGEKAKEKKVKEPFPPDETPTPPQVMDASKEPEKDMEPEPTGKKTKNKEE